VPQQLSDNPKIRRGDENHSAAPQAALIDHLNPIIRGWSATIFPNAAEKPFALRLPAVSKASFGQNVAIQTKPDIASRY